jgi:hypothetical protein
MHACARASCVHTRTHAHTHTRTRARTHARTHAHLRAWTPAHHGLSDARSLSRRARASQRHDYLRWGSETPYESTLGAELCAPHRQVPLGGRRDYAAVRVVYEAHSSGYEMNVNAENPICKQPTRKSLSVYGRPATAH